MVKEFTQVAQEISLNTCSSDWHPLLVLCTHKRVQLCVIPTTIKLEDNSYLMCLPSRLIHCYCKNECLLRNLHSPWRLGVMCITRHESLTHEWSLKNQSEYLSINTINRVKNVEHTIENEQTNKVEGLERITDDE